METIPHTVGAQVNPPFRSRPLRAATGPAGPRRPARGSPAGGAGREPRRRPRPRGEVTGAV